MKVEQIYQLANDITKEHLGEDSLIQEDLSNTVQFGDSIQNVMGMEKYLNSLVDHIGRMVFVDRSYYVTTPGVLMDDWEYGSILEKVDSDLPEAEENESWQLIDGQSYDPNIFYAPYAEAKFYNDLTTFEIHKSFADRQAKSAFSSPTQLNSFFSMIRNWIQNSMTDKLDGLIRSTINCMTAETFYNLDSGGSYSGKSGVRAVNVLHLYNQTVPQAEQISTVDEFIYNPKCIRFFVNILKNYIDRLRVMSRLFNVGGRARFTPKDRLHVIMLSEVKNAAEVFMQSDTFHDQYTALPGAETVPYWQGSGTSYSLSDTSSINLKNQLGHEVSASGILTVMFDRWALGVSNVDQRVTSNWNPKAEFYTEFVKHDARYFCDTNENFIVFYAA